MKKKTLNLSKLAGMKESKGTETFKTMNKKNTTVSIDVQVIKDFKGDPLSLSAFINIYGRKYLDGKL